MPGPPRGPSYRMITTSPALTALPRMPSTASSWLSNTLAGPVNVSSSSGTPAGFTIAPCGARLPCVPATACLDVAVQGVPAVALGVRPGGAHPAGRGVGQLDRLGGRLGPADVP